MILGNIEHLRIKIKDLVGSKYYLIVRLKDFKKYKYNAKVRAIELNEDKAYQDCNSFINTDNIEYIVLNMNSKGGLNGRTW